MTSDEVSAVAEANAWAQADEYWEARYDEYAGGWPNDNDYYEEDETVTDDRIKLACMWDEGCEPYRAHEDDAGLDLRAREDAFVRAGGSRRVGTGFHCNIPRGYVGLLVARSSLHERGLYVENGVGVIDSGYTGEVMVPLLARVSQRIARGERIVQLVIVPCVTPEVVRIRRFGDTSRGTGGFGSTGVGTDD